jgi:predicted nuclease of restriction endonuclease-like (RecB) superfamily
MKFKIEPTDYQWLLQRIIAEIKTTRVLLARNISHTTNQLYWNIGEYLSDKKISEGHGKSVVEQLAVDLKTEFPAYSFSPRYLWEMKRFYETYHLADLKLKQAVSVLPWGHNILLMQKIKNLDEALFYAEKAIEMGWSRNVLLNFIKTDAYENSQLLPKQHNFINVLPEHLQEQADEALKSKYNLAFLGVTQPIKELELERRLVDKIKHFILELGVGFSFIGNQYKLNLGEKEYFVDMLFFHRKLQSLVAIELKIGEFKPEYIGKMGFYLTLLDKQVKMPNENPSVGIILCADKDTMEVEIALQNATSPIAVAEYQLYFPKESIKQLMENEIKKEKKREESKSKK